MRLITKKELGQILIDFPLLRQLVFEPWFRVGFASFILILLSLLLILPKVWTASPDGFDPVVKVSGLDLLQAWSLRRTAEKAAKAEKWEDSAYAWQSAVANNPADTDLLHGFLNTFLQHNLPKKYGRSAVAQSSWLLRLTSTNASSVDLSARVFKKLGYSDQIIALLEPRQEQLPAHLRVLLMQAFFHQNRIFEFAQLWDRSGNEVKNDPDLKLYRAAYLAGWGPLEEATEAERLLDEALSIPTAQIDAAQLQLIIRVHKGDVDGYRRVLELLQHWSADTLQQHLAYWRMLVAANQKSKAKELAQAPPQPPRSTSELLSLAQFLVALGERDKAIELFSQTAGQFGGSPDFWIFYAIQLMDAKKWDALRNVALQIRVNDAVRDRLLSYSYYLEGRAELALERFASADRAFERVKGSNFKFPDLARATAVSMLQLGYPALARDILSDLEDEFSKDAAFWMLLFSAADQMKDVDLMLRTSKNAFELQPENFAALNNYAASLLIKRQDPDEVIKLTLTLMTKFRDSIPSRVNHGAALLLNKRVTEAAALLKSVNPKLLTRAQLSLYNMDMFETHLALGEYQEAQRLSEQIESQFLYPPQREWLQKAKEELNRQIQASL